jgi:hypothetical protein
VTDNHRAMTCGLSVRSAAEYGSRTTRRSSIGQ